ncbi:MAG TPA: hypothetical protein H9911_07575 [Candidatus Mediterraneibacter tabaqchaliae]|uniref:Uncharacterized protein n=1 Tax=Candidatus Mediterraneibacter tabaqchaliae TaxID=2838689 RepID=A0A9D2U310_9FIRM|nr:hypothetical protein [Candidatus Mediterraneibacter tabaqchaliae]
MDHNILKKSLRIAAVLSFFLFCAFAFSGCGHYSNREAAEWFQENVVDEGIMVSKEYTDRENSSGDAERVWTAHLKDLPEVEFELISRRTVSLFVTYDMETTYHLEMGRFYLENYKDSSPSALSGLETGTDVSEEHLTVSGIYDTVSEIDTICREMGNLEDYIAAQEYPCQVTYALAYREPLTFNAAKEPFTMRYTCVSEDGGAVPDSLNAGTLADTLRNRARNAFAGYAAAYRLETDQFTEDQLDAAAGQYGSLRFSITRPDGTELCYPELILAYYDSMSFGCLYEVLVREGTFQVSGTPEEFTFTAANGSVCSFSYSYRVPVNRSDETSGGLPQLGSFYYLSGETKVILTDAPLIDSERFSALTGLTFDALDH